MKLAYFWLTQWGQDVVEKLQQAIPGDSFGKQDFRENVRKAFAQYDGLVFVMATGIVVRTIAPLLQSKATDPAVVVLDQAGQYVISLLSGHLGGANALTCQIAAHLGAAPVITTATDVQGVVAFDEVAKRNNLVIENLSVMKEISGALLAGETVALHSDLALADALPPGITTATDTATPYRVVISDRQMPMPAGKTTLLLRPKSLVVGVGCKRGIPFQQMAASFQVFLQQQGISPLSLSAIATIPLKQEEPAILGLCAAYDVPLVVIAPEEIGACDYPFARSAFVQSVTGVPSVAEACSYLASDRGEILSGKVAFPGMTFCVCRRQLPPLTLMLGEET